MKTGTQLIAEERKRQIEKEGWTKEHDEQHAPGILSIAAAGYAVNKLPDSFLPDSEIFVCLKQDVDNGFFGMGTEYKDFFPFGEADKREKHSRLKSLVIAGALIAAEIDRELAENSQESLKQDICEIAGECENCGVILFEDDEYKTDSAGIILCKPCMKELVEENPKELNQDKSLFCQRNKPN